METSCVVTVVPISAPRMSATPIVMGMALVETSVTAIESKAPLLWMRAVPNQPTKTPVVVSLIWSNSRRTGSLPMRVTDSFIRTIEEMKKYMLRSMRIALSLGRLSVGVVFSWISEHFL